MRRASPFGRDAEERGEEGCIRCCNVSNDFFIPPLTCSAGALPKGEPHVEKRSLQNRISASSHMIQRRRLIASSEAGAKANCVQRSWRTVEDAGPYGLFFLLKGSWQLFYYLGKYRVDVLSLLGVVALVVGNNVVRRVFACVKIGGLHIYIKAS